MSQLLRMRLKNDEMAALIALAEKLEVSPSAVVREALRQHNGFTSELDSLREHLNGDLTTVSDGPVPTAADGVAGRDVVTWWTYRGKQEPCHD